MNRKFKLIIGAICTLVIIIGPAYFVYGVSGNTPPLGDIGMYSAVGVFSYIIGVTF